jgi:tetratricopeptide (TPR) repeat protein
LKNALDYKLQANELFKKGKYEDSIKFYTKALDVLPDHEESAAIYYNRAQAYSKLVRNIVQVTRLSWYSATFYDVAVAESQYNSQ